MLRVLVIVPRVVATALIANMNSLSAKLVCQNVKNIHIKINEVSCLGLPFWGGALVLNQRDLMAAN